MELLKTKTSNEFNFIKESLINNKNYNISLTFNEHNQELTDKIVTICKTISPNIVNNMNTNTTNRATWQL